MSSLVPSLQPFASTIFAQVSAAAKKYDAINLGQGYPDSDGPQGMLRVASDAILTGHNQYAPGRGVPELLRSIASYREYYYQQSFNPHTEVLVTVGATEAISAALIGLVKPGDDVVLIDPYYDSYAACVAMVGAQRLSVPLVLTNGECRLDLDQLASTVTPRTRVIIVNTPHNPTGSILNREELAAISEAAVKNDVIVLSDEVYERLTFDDFTHQPVAQTPGLEDRTITISSAAKVLNATGWKTGWAAGPQHLIDAVRGAKQYLSFVGTTPVQFGVSYALDNERDWIDANALELELRRNQLATGLRSIGFGTPHTQGTFFQIADAQPLGYSDAVELSRRLPAECGVAAIPLSSFTDRPQQWSSLLRFTFCKEEATISEGLNRLGRFFH